MLEELIESERVQLGGDARAPVLTGAEAPAIVVEAGEGYRPVSPSEHDRQHRAS